MTIETCQVKRFVEAFSGRCTERSILNRFITLGDFFPPILPSKRRRKRREPNLWSIPRGGRRRPWRLRRGRGRTTGRSTRRVLTRGRCCGNGTRPAVGEGKRGTERQTEGEGGGGQKGVRERVSAVAFRKRNRDGCGQRRRGATCTEGEGRVVGWSRKCCAGAKKNIRSGIRVPHRKSETDRLPPSHHKRGADRLNPQEKP